MKFLKITAILIVCFSLFSATESNKMQYQCMPCGLDCDSVMHDKPGKCADCNMELVKSSSIVFGTIKSDAICDYIKSHPKTILLDVRTKEEFEGTATPDFGVLKNAVNIPIQDLKTRLSELKPYKDTEIIVYCSHSHRSPRASYLLTQNGFSNIKNMSGGMSTVTDNSCKK